MTLFSPWDIFAAGIPPLPARLLQRSSLLSRQSITNPFEACMPSGFRAVGAVLCFLSMGFIGNGGGDDRNNPQGLRKTADDTDRNFTTAGNIALTVTNFGTIGTRNAYWPDQPSCEYPRGSRIEHLYQGGLWVGAVSRQSAQQHVSTGANGSGVLPPGQERTMSSPRTSARG